MKRCFKCDIVKPLTDYYKHPGMEDGHLNKCKECTKKDTKDRHLLKLQDLEWVESEQARHRQKYYRLGYKEKHKPTLEESRESLRSYRKRYPEKSFRRKTYYEGTHEHHWSYNREHRADTITILPTDHATLHRFIIYDEVKFKYRTKEGLLLDSKEAHVQYAETVVPGFEDRVKIHIEGLHE